MDLSIVILTFNAKDITLKMLDSLKESLDYLDDVSNGKVEWQTIVVDNGSADGIIDEMEEKYTGWLKLVRNKNVGFSKGNNRGVAEVDENSKYVLFLNPDIILDKESIYFMYQYMEKHKSVGLATCRVDLWSGGLDWDCHRSFPTPWRAFCYFSGLEKILGKTFPNVFGGYHLMYEDIDTQHEVDVCLGAFMLVRKEVGDEVNWWPEDYFLNGEDVDFCYQIKTLKGHKIMYVPDVKIIHYKGATKGTKLQSKSVTKASKKTKETQIKSGTDAMKIFYDKYYEDKYPRALTSIIYAGIWLLRKKRLLTGRE